MRMFTASLAALALAGCSGQGDNATAPAANEAAVNEAAGNSGEAVNTVAALGNLSEQQLQGVFLSAIRDAGLPCRDVVETTTMPPTGGKATWRAKCEDGDYHLVIVDPDGNAQVMSRTGS